ncbi:MAG: OmpA family protein [Bacteroidota bacterium]
MSQLYRYPGVKPFSQEESRVFFGRSDDIKQLSRYLRLENLVVLHGKSGLGKTSMINAGMLPLMEGNKEAASSSKEGIQYTPLPIRFRSFTPKAPRYLFDVFSENIPRKESFVDSLPVKTLDVWQVLKSRQLADGGDPKQGYLLILDQFEELFTYPEKEVDTFGRQLADLYNARIPAEVKKTMRREMVVNEEMKAAMEKEGMKDIMNAAVPVKILIAIRSDRFNLLDRFSDYLPEMMMHSLILEPFSREQAREAIEEPAVIEGDFSSPPFHYSKKASAKILDFLTANDTKRVEGFQLQIICRNIEEKLLEFLKDPQSVKEEDQFQFKIHEEDGSGIRADVTDIRADFSNILRRYYDEQIASLGDPEITRSARVLIEEELIAEGRRISMDVASIKSLEADQKRPVLEKLEATRIIRRVSNNQEGHSYEVSHDTLIEPILEAKAERLAEEDQERRYQEKQHAIEQRLETEKKAREERNRLRELEMEKSRRRNLATFLGVVILLLLLLVKFWYDEDKKGKELEQANNKLEARELELIRQKDSLRQQTDIAKGFFGASEKEWTQLLEEWKNKDTDQVERDIASFNYVPLIKELEEKLEPFPQNRKWKILKRYDELHIRLYVFSSSIVALSGTNRDLVRAVARVMSQEKFEKYEVLVQVHTTTDRTGSRRIGPSRNPAANGNVSTNIFISADRAKNAADELIKGGISPDRITIMGAGPNQPLVTEESNPDLSKVERNNLNRRLELVVSIPKDLE